MSPGRGERGPGVLWVRTEREKEEEEVEDGESVQRMLYASVSAVDGCCSVLARQRLGERERERERGEAGG